jgi:RHS repeat-associated protein
MIYRSLRTGALTSALLIASAFGAGVTGGVAANAQGAAPTAKTVRPKLGKPVHPVRSAPVTHHAEGLRPAHHENIAITSFWGSKHQGKSFGHVRSGALQPTAPFTECPAIGDDTSCGVLVDITNAGAVVYSDATQGPFDGADDTLTGVINDSSNSVSAITLAADTDLFGFDGDGICSGDYGSWDGSAGCPYGPTGYEGPGISFSDINADETGGVVDFSGGLGPNQTAYFSLEEPLTASQVSSGGPGASEQGGASNPSEHVTVCNTKSPVNCATGAFWHSFTDFSIPGRGVALDLTRTYNSVLAGVEGPFGFGWTDSYNMSLSTDSSGDATITQEDGSTVSFLNNGSGGFTSPPWVLASLVLNSDGSYTFTREASSIAYNFSSSGQLLSEVDRNGYTTSLTYSGSELTKVTEPAGRSLTYTYNGQGLVASVSDPMGHTETFTYDSSGDLTGQSNAAGDTWSFTYSSGHLMLTLTDPRGGKTSNTYNSSNQVVAQSDPLGRTTTWAYSGDATTPAGGTTTLTDPRGIVTVYNFTNLELNSVVHGSGTSLAATTSYTYDPATLGITSVTDPLGRVTNNSYDTFGNLLSSTDPLGNTTSYSYDSFNQVTSKTTPLGETTTYEYDGSGNLLYVIDALGNTTTYTYGDSFAGDVTEQTSQDGQHREYAYDAYGNQVSITDADGNVTTATFDLDGQKLTSVAPLGNVSGGTPSKFTTTYKYDALGDLLSTTDPLGHVLSYTYDADRNQITQTSPGEQVTTYSFDADNELLSTKLASGATSSSSYDADGNVATTTTAGGNVTTNTYDVLNRLTKTVLPLGHTTTYAFDADGERTSSVNPAGQTATYSYDADGNVLSITYSSNVKLDVAYAFDADGHRTSMSDATGTSTYSYDGDGHLLGSSNGAGASVAYAYNGEGQITSITYPGSHVVTQGFDADGNLVSVADWLGHTSTFSYDADGNEIGVTFGSTPSVHTTYAFDDANNLTSMVIKQGSTTLQSFTYARNADSLVATATPNSGPAITYAYNTINQLTQDAQGMYSYNADGDPTAVPGAPAQVFNAGDELTSTGTGKTKTTYTYDMLGDRLTMKPAKGTATTYAYDQLGRLIRYTAGKTVATYAYNGDSLLMTETVKSKKTAFVWDSIATTPLLLVHGNNDFIYGPGGLALEQVTTTGINFLGHNQLGSTTLLLSSAGAVLDTFAYDSFGQISTKTGTAADQILFGGEFLDPESGLYYLQARYYDPKTGVFVSIDPAVALSGAAYSFASDDPVNLVDPTGLDWWNPFSWSGSTWRDIGIGAGLVLGTISIATGVGAVVGVPLLADIGLDAGALGVISGATGALGTVLDAGPCLDGEDEYACVGAALSIPGDIAFLAGALPAGVLTEDALETLDDIGLYTGAFGYGWDLGDDVLQISESLQC